MTALCIINFYNFPKHFCSVLSPSSKSHANTAATRFFNYTHRPSKHLSFFITVLVFSSLLLNSLSFFFSFPSVCWSSTFLIWWRLCWRNGEDSVAFCDLCVASSCCCKPIYGCKAIVCGAGKGLLWHLPSWVRNPCQHLRPW